MCILHKIDQKVKDPVKGPYEASKFPKKVVLNNVVINGIFNYYFQCGWIFLISH